MTLAKHIEAAIIEGGWTVHASDFEGERLVIRCDGPKAESLVLWVLPAGAGEEPCFTHTGNYLLGYRGETLSDAGKRLLEVLAGELIQVLPPEVEPAAVPATTAPSLIYGRNQLEIRVTLKCLEECVFCNSWGVAENLAASWEDAQGMLLAAREQGATKLVITGGEPLMVPWAIDLVGRARAAGFGYVVLQTNGVLLARQETLDSLLSAEPDEVLISVHGCTAATLGEITRRPALVRRKLAGLRNALQAGLRVTVNFVLCRQNLEEMEDYVAYLAKLQTRPYLVSFSFVAPSGLAWENRRETIPRLSASAPRLLTALRLAGDRGLNVVHSEYCGVPTCLEPGLREFAEPCTDDRPMHVPPDKTKLPACDACSWSRRCSGIFKRYLEMYGEEEFGL